MQIIPAIDILQGQVVHARPGARKDYLPIQSSLSDAAAPEAIIDALLDLFPFKIIYLADLDAIRERRSEVNKHLICRLLLKYPQISFWLDAGIDGTHSLPDHRDTGCCRPIYGTENKLHHRELDKLIAARPELIISLDCTAAGLTGNTDILDDTTHWPDTIIIMSLHKVGSGSGPDIGALNQVKRPLGDRNIFAAGGIRNKRDLQQLHENGFAGGLIATALHNGVIDESDLVAIASL